MNLVEYIEKHKNNLIFFALSILFIFSFFIYLDHYNKPRYLFWDENYHIASAQKYIDGVAFMEPHPPLGKLLIAEGEKIWEANTNLNLAYMDKTDYITSVPSEYSFKGVRFFPALFAMISIIPFFLIIYLVSKHLTFSFLLSSLYLFENAFVVHSRAAMLESIQLFFILMVLLVFIWMKENKKYTIGYFALLGIFSGLAISTKANSLIVVLFPISWLWFEKKYIVNLENIKEVVGRFFVYGFGIVIIVFAVFYMHFSLGKKIENNRKYSISNEYLSFIENNQTSNILNFSIMLRDNLKFMNNYQKGVPKLDLCKVGENGSLAIGWPLGIKSINYRWLKKDGKVEYTYLQGNPIIWFSVFFGILLSFSLIVSKYIFRYSVKNERLFEYILLFTVLYLSYMIAVLQIDRVMYMYHYFVALVFGMFNLAFMIFYLFKEYIDTHNVRIFMGVGLFVAIVVWIFFQFSPLTYSIPIDTKQFESLQWFDFWKLTVIK